MEILATVHPHTNELTGSLPRAEAIQSQAWCRSTNIYVMNHAGEILCHQRSLQKERMPGVWVTHLGGHVGADESYLDNAHKELAEESGIQLDQTALIPWRTTKLEEARLWVKEYVVLIDAAAHKLIPQPGEVEKFSWFSPQDILALSEQNGDQWCAGTHDFKVEYHCLKSALTVAHANGTLTPDIDLQTWHPLTP